MTTDNRTNEQIVAQAMSGGNRACSTHDIQVVAAVSALRAAGRLADEQEIRDSIARDIWNDEQECNLAIRLAKIGSHDHTGLLGRLAGLQRARDISQGVLVRDLDEAKLARMIDKALVRHTEMAGLSNEERWEMRDDVAVSVAAYLRGES